MDGVKLGALPWLASHVKDKVRKVVGKVRSTPVATKRPLGPQTELWVFRRLEEALTLQHSSATAETRQL